MMWPAEAALGAPLEKAPVPTNSALSSPSLPNRSATRSLSSFLLLSGWSRRVRWKDAEEEQSLVHHLHPRVESLSVFPEVAFSLGKFKACGTELVCGNNHLLAVCSLKNQLFSIEALKTRLNAELFSIIHPTENSILPE